MQQVINIIKWQGSYKRGKMEFKPSTYLKVVFTFLPTVMTPEGFKTCCYDIYKAKQRMFTKGTLALCAEMRNEAM